MYFSSGRCRRKNRRVPAWEAADDKALAQQGALRQLLAEPRDAKREDDTAADRKPDDLRHEIEQIGVSQDDPSQDFQEVSGRNGERHAVNDPGHLTSRKHES